jgi:hypothetical protein
MARALRQTQFWLFDLQFELQKQLNSQRWLTARRNIFVGSTIILFCELIIVFE